VNWALTADGMVRVSRHRADVPVDSCRITGDATWSSSGCKVCEMYQGKHRREVRL
jgi:hypothetical protein